MGTRFALYEIPPRELGERGIHFVRDITLKFPADGDLSPRQWTAVERVVQSHRPQHEFNPRCLEPGKP